jgi:Acyl-CoA dehydrogenase, C-terminal domain
MPGLSAAAATGAASEAAQFAETVAALAHRHRVADPWVPGATVSDASPELAEALAGAGWDSLAEEPELLVFVAPAAVELGRNLASLAGVDRLLGGALRDGSLGRYAHSGGRLAAPRGGRIVYAEAGELEALPYADSFGVARILSEQPAGWEEGAAADVRMRAWVAGSAGYLAGACHEALRLALEHTRTRQAFGRPLAALDPVQQTLADAATVVDGLLLLARGEQGADALLHAGEASERALAGLQQVTGALGFTLEFPMGRIRRRMRASRVWAEAALDAWERDE